MVLMTGVVVVGVVMGFYRCGCVHFRASYGRNIEGQALIGKREIAVS